jgi:phosphate transport system protein
MKILEEKLDKVRYSLAQMASISQSMLKDSTLAVINMEKDLAKSVIKRDGEVDRFDNEIEEMCFKILAMYNPRAFDLRFVISALRITVDLERIGDSCVNISKQVKHFSAPPQKEFREDIENMANAAYDMVEASLKAFFNNDVKMALKTIKKDDYIDKMNKQIITKTVNYITEKPEIVKEGVALIYVVRNIERIADHATNVCEFVYFKETGKSIKHTYFDSVKEILGNGEDTAD